jgi:hypothetical protein
MAKKGMTRRNYKETILNLIEIVMTDRGNPKWQLWQLRAVLKELKLELDIQEEKVYVSTIPRRKRTQPKTSQDGTNP